MLFPNSNALNRVFRNDPDGFSAFVNFPDQKTLCSALHVPRIRRVYPVPPFFICLSLSVLSVIPIVVRVSSPASLLSTVAGGKRG